MAVVTVQVGQCGNQLGKQFFSTLMEDVVSNSSATNSRSDKMYEDDVLERFFDTRNENIPEARAVLLDMENKVRNMFTVAS